MDGDVPLNGDIETLVPLHSLHFGHRKVDRPLWHTLSTVMYTVVYFEHHRPKATRGCSRGPKTLDPSNQIKEAGGFFLLQGFVRLTES